MVYELSTYNLLVHAVCRGLGTTRYRSAFRRPLIMPAMPAGQDKRFGSLCQFREMGGREVFGFYSESQNPFLWVWTRG